MKSINQSICEQQKKNSTQINHMKNKQDVNRQQKTKKTHPHYMIINSRSVLSTTCYISHPSTTYHTHQLYISDQSTDISDTSAIYIRPINYTSTIYISDPSAIYIRPINYIYHTHQLYISDTSAMISDPSTICITLIYCIYITPINYLY